MLTTMIILRLRQDLGCMEPSGRGQPKPVHTVQVDFHFCRFMWQQKISHFLSCHIHHPPPVNTREIRLFHSRTVWLNCIGNNSEENLQTSHILQMKKLNSLYFFPLSETTFAPEQAFWAYWPQSVFLTFILSFHNPALARKLEEFVIVEL